MTSLIGACWPGFPKHPPCSEVSILSTRNPAARPEEGLSTRSFWPRGLLTAPNLQDPWRASCTEIPAEDQEEEAKRMMEAREGWSLEAGEEGGEDRKEKRARSVTDGLHSCLLVGLQRLGKAYKAKS